MDELLVGHVDGLGRKIMVPAMHDRRRLRSQISSTRPVCTQTSNCPAGRWRSSSELRSTPRDSTVSTNSTLSSSTGRLFHYFYPAAFVFTDTGARLRMPKAPPSEDRPLTASCAACRERKIRWDFPFCALGLTSDDPDFGAQIGRELITSSLPCLTMLPNSCLFWHALLVLMHESISNIRP